MELEIEEHIIRTIIISLSGRVDAFESPKLRSRVKELQAEGVNRFILDLSNTAFLDSAGMAVLVSALKTSRKMGGDVKLVWPRADAAKRIISLTKFDRVFDMFSSAQDAIGSFQ